MITSEGSVSERNDVPYVFLQESFRPELLWLWKELRSVVTGVDGHVDASSLLDQEIRSQLKNMDTFYTLYHTLEKHHI